MNIFKNLFGRHKKNEINLQDAEGTEQESETKANPFEEKITGMREAAKTNQRETSGQEGTTSPEGGSKIG